MGLEAECKVNYAGQKGTGKAHLESKHISFKGPFRFKLPFLEIERFEAQRRHLGTLAERAETHQAEPRHGSFQASRTGGRQDRQLFRAPERPQADDPGGASLVFPLEMHAQRRRDFAEEVCGVSGQEMGTLRRESRCGGAKQGQAVSKVPK